MGISYEKAIALFQEQGITTYTIKKNKIIGQAAFAKIHEGGHIDTRTIERLCKYFSCQPGDLMEYVPDPATERQLIDVETGELSNTDFKLT